LVCAPNCAVGRQRDDSVRSPRPKRRTFSHFGPNMLPGQPPLIPADNRAQVRQAHFDSINVLAVSSLFFLSAFQTPLLHSPTAWSGARPAGRLQPFLQPCLSCFAGRLSCLATVPVLFCPCSTVPVLFDLLPCLSCLACSYVNRRTFSHFRPELLPRHRSIIDPGIRSRCPMPMARRVG
jgi:hypothetical protein